MILNAYLSTQRGDPCALVIHPSAITLDPVLFVEMPRPFCPIPAHVVIHSEIIEIQRKPFASLKLIVFPIFVRYRYKLLFIMAEVGQSWDLAPMLHGAPSKVHYATFQADHGACHIIEHEEGLVDTNSPHEFQDLIEEHPDFPRDKLNKQYTCGSFQRLLYTPLEINAETPINQFD